MCFTSTFLCSVFVSFSFFFPKFRIVFGYDQLVVIIMTKIPISVVTVRFCYFNFGYSNFLIWKPEVINTEDLQLPVFSIFIN